MCLEVNRDIVALRKFLVSSGRAKLYTLKRCRATRKEIAARTRAMCCLDLSIVLDIDCDALILSDLPREISICDLFGDREYNTKKRKAI